MVERELEPWEKKYLARQKELKNYRGRRLRACRAADTLNAVIASLGEDDGSELPIPDHVMPPPPTEQQKKELQNMVACLLRMILILNDGRVSHQELRRF